MSPKAKKAADKSTPAAAESTLLEKISDTKTLTVITALKRICVVLLMIVVAIGVYLYDPRFTALFVPPYILYMHFTMGEGWYNELPAVMWFNRIYSSGPFGPAILAFAGVAAGAYVNGWLPVK